MITLLEINLKILNVGSAPIYHCEISGVHEL